MLLAIISLAHSQTPNEVRINPRQATVYFTPERLAGDQLWLRLHNNSRWAISFRTEQPVEITVPFRLADGREVKSLIEGAEISPQYVIDNPVIGWVFCPFMLELRTMVDTRYFGIDISAGGKTKVTRLLLRELPV